MALALTAACTTIGAPPAMSSGEVRRGIAAALEAQDRSGVTLGMHRLAAMGASLSPETQARLAPLLDPTLLPHSRPPQGPAEQILASNFRYNAREQVDSELFAEVPASHRLIEGIAWDEARQHLFVGSVIDRELLVREGEAWRTVPTAEPIGGVFGMAVDAPRRLLWFASAGVAPMVEPEAAFSGIVAIDLDRLQEARRIPVPGAKLGDVAVAEDGTVYASDGQSGAIYRCVPGCTAAEILVAPGTLPSPQGMVVARGGRRLYVADYSLGLFRVEIERRQVLPMIVRRPEMLDGIDGLLFYAPEHALIGIQNGTLPRRIVKIALDHTGTTIDRVRALEQNNPASAEPTMGTMIDLGVDFGLIFIADGQWERWTPGAVPAAGTPPGPTPIRRMLGLDDIVVTQAVFPAEPSLASPRPRS